ncbi:MBL fold metallo-hydrolase [Burkholderia cenocepacia]|uniref:MBL fold metallo-hydrolase n=1 Tax=Burkholderia cenocepacia TaxID=95486 RepID=A0AAW4TN27_9BURK|nr:MBL fold metallo-hydrolase [Burkholderia cenocepacia]MCA8381900.1 MBL fold metallo-hydrolase [Burkholderia cenocepacia]
MKTLFQHACVAQAARLLIVAGCAGLLAPAAFAQAGVQPDAHANAQPETQSTTPAAAAGRQPPGFYRQKIGDFTVIALSDGTHPFPVDTVFRDISKDEIRRDLDRAFLEPPVQGSINAFLVDTGSKRILVDAGAGTLYGDCCGKLLDDLRAAGYAPAQIDEVLLTHLHKDHVGGIASNGAMTFPNAVVRVNAVEAAYWLDPANKAHAPAFLASFFDAAAAAVAPYVAAGRFKTFRGDATLAPGIRAVPMPGHTPGHTAYLIESGHAGLLAWGDIVHVAAIQLRDVDATVQYDSDAATARRTRRDTLKRVAARRYLVGAAHIAFPGLGHLRRDGAQYDWVPVNYDATPVR